MNFKSTLWALAFACAAVSCSDDIEEVPNGGNDDNLNGETAKMVVSINSDVVTKVSKDPEEGDHNELGESEEREVRDLTVFLFADGDDDDTNGITFTKTSHIAAVGYSSQITSQGTTDHPSKHGWEAQVEVVVNEKDTYTFPGQTYGVLAVTNIGSETLKDQTFNNVEELANYLQASIYTDKFGFVMSTHMLVEKDNTTHNSQITFPAAGDNTIPSVEVYVERLAAKIRINPASNVTDFLYNVGKNVTNSTDKVQLNKVAIINQLSSGSYLLKRATNKTSLLDELTIGKTETDAKDVLLEDEAYETVTTGKNKANFVIDPWTRVKAIADGFPTDGGVAVGSLQGKITLPTDAVNKGLAYANPLVVQKSESDKSFKDYATLFDEFDKVTGDGFVSNQKKSKTLAKNTAITATAPLTLAYTMENTTNVVNSKQGFSTGALFQATYYAKQVMQIKTDNNKEVEMANTKWGANNDATDLKPEDLTFYTYGLNEVKYASYEAIFAHQLAKVVPSNGTGEDGTFTEDDYKGYYYYNSFMTPESGDNSTFQGIKIEEYIAGATYANASDPFGYMAYINEKVKAYAEANKDQLTNKTFKDITDLKTFSAFIKDLTETQWAEIHKTVHTYENGVCYYLTWLRHEDNEIYAPAANAMGAMEFVIVRNNIYDMTVSGITALGESGTDIPDPKKDDEGSEMKMRVLVKVKNWVVRNNGNIWL